MSSIRRAQFVYYLILALFWFATSLPAALGVLIIQSRGFPLSEIGLFLGIYSLTIVLLEVPTGGLADAVGRKRVTLLAYAVTACGSAAYFFAYSAWAFALAFALNGVGRALSSGALDAWFVDTVQALDPEVDLQPLLARAGTFSLLALGLGTLLGSALPMRFAQLPPDGSALLTPLTTPLVGAFSVFVIAFVATLVLVREDRTRTETGGWLAGVRAAPQMVTTALDLSRRNPTIVLLVTATMAGAFAILSLELLWQPHFAGIVGGVTGNSVIFGMIMAGNFIAGMVGNMIAPAAGRLLGKRYALLAALFQAIRGAAMILLALQTGLVPGVALFWLVYMSMGVVNSPHATLLNGQIPAQYRSSMLSVDSLLGYVGAFFSSVIMGYVASWAGIRVAWIVGGAVLLLSVGLYLRVAGRAASQLGPAGVAEREFEVDGGAEPGRGAPEVAVSAHEG